LIRMLVKRVEIGKEEIRVVFRLPPDLDKSGAGEDSMHYCWKRDDAPLRGTGLSCVTHTIFQDTCVKPQADEFQHPSVADPSFEQPHQHGLVDGVEVTLNIGVYHPPAGYQSLLDLGHSLLCAAFRAKAIRVVAEVGFKDRFDHQLASLLHHPVAHRWDTQWSLPTIRFRDVDSQDRSWAVIACFQVLLNLAQKLFLSFLFHTCDGDAIFPSAATVSADFFPGLSQNVRPEYAVIERMEPSVPVPLNRQV
jgi:hypothetical protein